MLHTIIDYNDIFLAENKINSYLNVSTNPYDYIRSGFFLEVPSVNGGHNNVSYNCLFSGDISSNMHDISNK